MKASWGLFVVLALSLLCQTFAVKVTCVPSDCTILEGDAAGLVVTVSKNETSDPQLFSWELDFTNAASPKASAADIDSTPTSGNVTANATITITATADNVYELAENVKLLIKNGTVVLVEHTLTITNADTAPTVSIADASSQEGNTGSTNELVFAVTLERASSQAETIAYSITNGNTTAADYTTPQAPLEVVFAAGDVSKNIRVAVNGDTTYETDETLTVTLANSGSSGITWGSSDLEATGTILNDDPKPIVSLADAAFTEASGKAVLTASLSSPSYEEIRVSFSTTDGSASSVGNADYTSTTSVFIFTAGSTSSAPVEITISQDNLHEADTEDFFVNLNSVTVGQATLPQSATKINITDSDSVQIYMSSPTLSVTEGNSSTVNADVIVLLTRNTTVPLSVQYSTANGAATAGSDYVSATNIVLTFNPGQFSRTASIVVNGDRSREPNEAFTVRLASPTGRGVTVDAAKDTTTVTIVNDDPVPQISITPLVSILEGNSATVPFVFNVTLSNPASTGVDVTYHTQNVNATAPSDYTAIGNTLLSFTSAEEWKLVTVNVNGDTLFEADETFDVVLSSPVNGVILNGVGQGVIRNDETTPLLSIANAAATLEGQTASFTVTLSPANQAVVTVNYASSQGTATTDVDFTAVSGVLTFPSGSTTQTIQVAIAADAIDEDNEQFSVTISSPVNASLSATTTATGVITDNNNAPTVGIVAAVNITSEGNTGVNRTATFTVTLSAASSKTVQVSYTTEDDTASAGTDYVATSGTLTFLPGETSAPVQVTVIGDNTYEADETFDLTLSAPQSATLDAAATTRQATITNDDPLPVVTFRAGNPSSVSEGDLQPVPVTLSVTLSNPSYQPVTVHYKTEALYDATSGQDFQDKDSSVVFAPGEFTRKDFDVVVLGDTIQEADEVFAVTLYQVDNGAFPQGSPSGLTTNITILDDEGEPRISFATASLDVTVSESTANVVLTVNLDKSSSSEITVRYNTTTNTVFPASSFVPVMAGLVTFAPTTTSQTITIQLKADSVNEPNEVFSVVLYGPSGATLVAQQFTAQVTITDDDPLPIVALSAATFNVQESETSVTLDVTLSAAYGAPVTVVYQTFENTAGSADFQEVPPTTLTFQSGEVLKSITVTLYPDNLQEVTAVEDFNVVLSSPVNATLGRATSSVRIQDDDPVPTVQLTLATIQVSETNANTSVNLNITLSNPTEYYVTVDFSVQALSAIEGQDFVAPATTYVDIEPENLVALVPVKIVGDSYYEFDEQFLFALTGATRASLGTQVSSLVTITNDDPVPQSVLVELHLDADFATFDQAQFIQKIAAVLVIDPSRISIRTVVSGSVIVTFAIVDAPNSPGAQVATQLVTMVANNDPKLTNEGLTVIGVKLIEAPAATSEPLQESSEEAGLSSGALIAIIVVPIGFVLLGILVLIVVVRYKNTHRGDSEHDKNSIEMGVKRRASLPKENNKQAAQKGSSDESEDASSDETDSDDSSSSEEESGSEETDDSDESDDSADYSDDSEEDSDDSSGSGSTESSDSSAPPAKPAAKSAPPAKSAAKPAGKK